MFLRSITSAFPENSLTQGECAALAELDPRFNEELKPNSQQLLQTILTGDSGISKRHFAIDDPQSAFGLDAGELNRNYERHAPALASEALVDALERAGLAPSELDAVFICTCTGYLCPGLSSYVAEQIGLRQDALLHDVVGLGCGAAVPTMRTAAHFLNANPDATAAVVAVEICSAAFFVCDDPGVLISLCLFGDGASASIWQGRKSDDAQLEASGFRSLHIPEEREKIRFVNDGGKLRNKLHRSVPEIAAETVSKMYAEAPEPRQNDRPVRLLSHTGGRDVIAAIRGALPQFDLKETAHVLDQYGNMSSPCVLIALQHYLENTRPEEAENLYLATFGAGFSCHTCWVG